MDENEILKKMQDYNLSVYWLSLRDGNVIEHDITFVSKDGQLYSVYSVDCVEHEKEIYKTAKEMLEAIKAIEPNEERWDWRQKIERNTTSADLELPEELWK